MFADLLVLVFIIFHQVAAGKDEAKNKTIQELEKQKSDLYKQINNAIDESVKSLLAANDTEAKMGLEYMRDLKEHIEELNRTELGMNEEKEMDIDSKSDLENRRKYKGLQFFKQTRKPRDPFDFESVLKPKKISAKEWKEMITNRMKMQKKLDEWIIERQKQKERLKKYRFEKKQLVMSGKYEKCPRFGYEGKKKKEKDKGRDKIRYCKKKFIDSMDKEYEQCIGISKRGENDEKRNKKMVMKNKYPCCRKCCKKSYMGCL